MKRILLVLVLMYIAILGYRSGESCKAWYCAIAKSEENRGLMVSTAQGASAAIYRDGYRGAPHENITLCQGGELTWCGLSIREKDGAIYVRYRQQEEIIEPRNMTRVNEDGTEQRIWNAVVFDDDAHYIRLEYGLCTEPPCAAASMNPWALMRMMAHDYFRYSFIPEALLSLQLLSIILIILLLCFMPLRGYLFALYAVFAASRMNKQQHSLHHISWQIQERSQLKRLFGCDHRYVLLHIHDKAFICYAYDENWLIFQWNMEHEKTEAASLCLEQHPPKMIPASAGFFKKCKFAWSSITAARCLTGPTIYNTIRLNGDSPA